MPKNTRLFALILLATVFLGLLLFREIEKARDITTKATNEPLISESAVPISISEKDPVLGNPGAPITIVEFLDLKNTRSKELHLEIADFVGKRPQSVRLVLKHAPLSGFFSSAELVHRGLYCAGEQDKTWDYLETFIRNRYKATETGARQAASDVKLDINKWWKCTSSDEAKASVQSGITEEQNMNAGKPPLIYLNNRKVNLQEQISITQLLNTVTK